jgi:2,3-dihydroxyphenylpropionate 1,2-dioxygenase
MGKIVLGVGASHTTLMNTHWEALVHVDRAQRFRDALYQARDAVAAAKPDVAVIVGSNHFRGFFLDLMPAFTIGVGDVIAAGEAGTPAGPQRTDPALARHIAQSLSEADFDIAFSAKLQVDHGITHAIQYVLAGLTIPVLPIVVNVFAPPMPTLRRCAQLGAELGRAIGSFAEPRRVVVIASGGLSHHLPWPDWRAPEDEDDAFLVEAFTHGRENWTQYEAGRREIVVKAGNSGAAKFQIDEDFDKDFLVRAKQGALREYASLTTRQLQDAAGNGGQEIRSWLIADAAMGHRPAEILAYEAIPEWLTGMAVALFRPS